MNFHNTTGSYLDDRYTNILQWEERAKGTGVDFFLAN